MIRRTAVYLLVFILTVYLFFMYDDTVISGMLVLEIIYPAASFVYLYYSLARITCTVGSAPAMGEKNKQVLIKLKAENRSRIWSAHIRMKLSSGNSFMNKKKRYSIPMVLERASVKKQRWETKSPYCGSMEVCLESVKVYDFLGIFYRKKEIGEKRQIQIMPEFNLMPLEVTRRTREFIADADEYSTERSGDDPADIYQIREYNDKDSIHDIHWKLSAKEDNLMVKEHVLPLGCTVLVWIDLEGKGMTGQSYDRMIERTASLSMSLTEEKCIHMAAWFEEKNQRVVRKRIDSEEAVYSFIWRLLVTEPYTDKKLMNVFYEDEFKGEQFSSIVWVEADGRFIVNGTRQEFVQV